MRSPNANGTKPSVPFDSINSLFTKHFVPSVLCASRFVSQLNVFITLSGFFRFEFGLFVSFFVS